MTHSRLASKYGLTYDITELSLVLWKLYVKKKGTTAQSFSKRAKKGPKGQTYFLGPTKIEKGQKSGIWPQTEPMETPTPCLYEYTSVC